MNPSFSKRLNEIAGLFLKLGVTAFGGPAAHIAMMHDETVKRRKWLSDQEFLDLVGATNLSLARIPPRWQFMLDSYEPDGVG